MRTDHPTSVRNRSDSAAGFTVTELLVVVTVMAIALLVTIPNLQLQTQRIRVVEPLRELRSAVDRARFEALRRHSLVVVWFRTAAREVVVFEDRDRNDDAAAGNGNGLLDTGEQVLQRLRLDSHLVFARPGGGTVVDLGGDRLVFRPDGRLTPPGAAVPAVYLGDKKGRFFRVRVNRVTGATQVEMQVDTAWSRHMEAWKWN